MRAEWEQAQLVEPWAQAMGEHGDYWRQVLINPLVLAVAERVAAGGDPFALSVFEPLLRGLPSVTARAGGAGTAAGAPASLAGVNVLDLGCGEGCLGRLLCGRGASYVGLDSSEALLAIARRRAQAAGHEGRARFLTAELEGQAAPALAGAGAASMVVAAVVLDHLSEVTGFLGTLAGWARTLSGDVPLLLITLAPERFQPVKAEVLRSGERIFHQRAVIESCQREVTVWQRSRRTYERMFRDAGLFIRRGEPLFFHREHSQAAPDQKDDASRRPVFWAWLLSARHGAVPPAATVTWPEDSDAAALRASMATVAPTIPVASHPPTLTSVPPAPALSPATGSGSASSTGSASGSAASAAPGARIFDFRPGEFIIRVHNMGGELYGVLSGAAKMMDGSQELMTFRAGEVLGDLETPDASGQCGSFPFDVVASEEGCRIALYPEPHATAVLARSHDIGSRFFRLLRDRLRLALWHYDIRELVGEYLECGNERLEKRLLHRCARALLWAAAIEGRGRAITFGEEIAFLDPETIARRFKPGTERIDFGVVIRQLHLLRMIDAFPGAALRKEEEARASASWETLVTSATRQHLAAGLDAHLQATIKAHTERLRVSGQLTKDGNRTRQFQDVVDDLATTVPGPAFRERLERWSAYIARAHRFWEDRNPWLIVLRDVPALRRIALGDAAGIDHTLGARAEYLLTEARRPTWELVTAQAFTARRKEYISILDQFVASDLAHDSHLAFSSEAGA
jgi:2-polyprenyl-3-methyl-5-hydroxy-6-metoxy-1,4-benzoquinol methylase/CRP-like cAMP-binding protein